MSLYKIIFYEKDFFMNREEFEKRTGYYPSVLDYKIIEEFYLNHASCKDEFCKAYVSNIDNIAWRIQVECDRRHIAAAEESERNMKELHQLITTLKEKLRYEEEWKPYVDKDNVSQAAYDKLYNDKDTKRLSDNEAKDLLFRWFGFSREKVTIIRSIPIFEVNRHGYLKKIGEAERIPLYFATDWNYIRFDAGQLCWELHDDTLRPYMQ